MGMRERDGASLVAQLVKNPPVTQEPQKTWVRSLGQENSLEEGTSPTLPQPAPSRARRLEAGERWARLAQARAAVAGKGLILPRGGNHVVFSSCGVAPGVGDGQGGLACCDSWGRKESDTTERLN